MVRTATLALLVTLAGPGIARGEAPERHGWGVGAEGALTGDVGATLSYDPGLYRVQALLGLDVNSSGSDSFRLHGRLFRVVHRGTESDLSLFGGLGYGLTARRGSATEHAFHVEAAGQARAFIKPNVSLEISLGFAIARSSARQEWTVLLGGQLPFFGLTYYLP